MGTDKSTFVVVELPEVTSVTWPEAALIESDVSHVTGSVVSNVTGSDVIFSRVFLLWRHFPPLFIFLWHHFFTSFSSVTSFFPTFCTIVQVPLRMTDRATGSHHGGVNVRMRNQVSRTFPRFFFPNFFRVLFFPYFFFHVLFFPWKDLENTEEIEVQ